MHICSEKAFKELVSSTPGLCAWGMGSDELSGFNKMFYRANKYLLLNSYREFVTCCTWLQENCTTVSTVSAKSPTSAVLQQLAKYPRYVGNGAMIAAIIHLGIPFTVDPLSPYVQVGISLESRCFKRESIARIPELRLVCHY